MKFRHFFLPHPETHAKAHLVSPVGLFVWIALFIILQVSLNLVNTVHPGILGVNANIDYKEVIRLTNVERAKKGLPELKENANLNVAANEKGKNMFEEQYWAHYSPSGKDPWGFILRSGYKYSYAGENLARNFNSADDAVVAWMNSPTHRDNILNTHYREVGISVVHGTLNGEETTLIVQEFGTPVEYTASLNPFNQIAKASPNPTVAPSSATIAQASPQAPSPSVETVANEEPNNEAPGPFVASAQFGPPNSSGFSINQFELYRAVGIGLVGGIGLMLLVDWVVLRRRGVYRPAAQHIAHLALLGVSFSALLNMASGKVL